MKTGKNIFTAVTALALVFFGGCGADTGLGESVDTAAPTLEITYPPSSSVIKEHFTLAGVCNDDKSIDRIEVRVRNVETQKEEDAVLIDPVTIVYNETKTAWSVTLNNKTEDGYEYKDGKYELSAIVYDNADHKSVTVSRTVEIDNTPPLFFITSPQIDDSNDITNYGTKFKVVGTIADAHKVSKMQVVVYDKDGVVVAQTDSNPLTISNVVTAGGTSETLASFIKYEDESNLNKNYVSIYYQGDETTEGTKTYSCKITLTDEAKVYRTPSTDASRSANTEETVDGNTSSDLYAYYNIRDVVGADIFNAADMMNVLNGTYTGENLATLQEALQAEGNKQSTARFTLNPKANPSYNVIGFGFDKTEDDETEVWSETTAKAKFTVVATQGLNQTALIKDSMDVYLVGPFEPTDNLVGFLASDVKTVVDKLYADMEDLSYEILADSKSGNPLGVDALFAAYKEREDVKTLIAENNIEYFEHLTFEGMATGSGESYNYAYNLPAELPVAGQAYFVLATGWDRDQLVFSNNGTYFGMKYVVQGNKPSFKAVKFVENSPTAGKEIAASGFDNSHDISITGTASSDSGQIISVTYNLVISDEGSSADDTTLVTVEKIKESYEEGKRSANQPFTLDLTKHLTEADKEKLAPSGRYLYAVELIVEATAGGSFNTQYVVHIDTKSPVIEFTSAKGVYTDTVNKKSWVGKGGLTQLRGSIDEENPKNVSYAIKKNGTVVKSGDLGAVYSLTLDEEHFSGLEFATDDKFQVAVQAEDKAGNSGSGESDIYYADAEDPVLDTSDEKQIKIGGKNYTADPDKKQWQKDTALTFTGLYNDKYSGVEAVYYVINEAVSSKEALVEKAKDATKLTAENAVSGAMGVTNGAFGSTISGFQPSGKNTIYIAAADNVGNISSFKTYELYIDQTPPEFDEVEEKDRNLATNGTEDITLKFKVYDQKGASGIDTDTIAVTAFANGTEYPLAGIDGCALAAADKITDDDGDVIGYNISYTITKEYVKNTHTSLDEKKKGTEFSGNVTIKIVVADNAGNTSTNQQYMLQVDVSAPEVKVTSPKAPAANAAISEINWIKGKTTLMGTVNDKGVSGVDVTNFKYLIPTVAQQKAVEDAVKAVETSSEKKEARIATLKDANWKDFASEVNVTWELVYESSYLEAPQGKPGTKAAGKDSFVYYGAATDKNGKLLYATEYGTTAAEKERYRTVPVYFLVTDLAGNQDVDTEQKFYIDVKGGMPSATISYPKDKTEDDGITVKSWAKLSEEVSLQGTAQDNESVEKVILTELYYATEEASTVYTNKDTASYWTRIKKTDLTENDIIAVDGKKANIIAAKDADGKDTVYLALEQNPIPSDSVVVPFDIEFNLKTLADSLKEANGAKITAIKAVVAAYDENDYGYSTTRYAFIDTETPQLSNEKIIKLNKALETTQIGSVSNGKVYAVGGTELSGYQVLVERKYEPDMWLSGLADDGTTTAHWYYVGTVTDDSVVEGVTLTAQVDTDHPISFKTDGQITPASVTTTYTFAIPIPVTADGAMYSKLTRDDGSHKDVNSYVSLHVDNTAPQMRTVKTDTAKEDFAKTVADGKLKLVADGDLGAKYVVENSNGSFSFGDQAKEDGSGLAFIGFWFERPADKQVYNPVVKSDTASTYKIGSNASVATYTGTTKPTASGTVYVNGENLPALYVNASDITVGATSGTDSVTTITYNYTSLASKDFINHSYGMVKINGSYYKVKNVNGTTFTLDSDLGLSGAVDVEFIYANFVDHIGTELFVPAADGKTYTVENDDDDDAYDGDGIAESLKVKSGIYTWSAEFDSTNMKDGPVRIHVVAVDNAGNISNAYVDTSIQNNRPRVAKVFLATNLDGSADQSQTPAKPTFFFDEKAYKNYEDYSNLSFETAFGTKKTDPLNPRAYTDPTIADGTEIGEFVFFSTLDKNGNASALAEIRDRGPNNNFIVKDQLLVLPELVGGNGEVKYAYEFSDIAEAPAAPDAPKQVAASELRAFETAENYTTIASTEGTAATKITGLPDKAIYFANSDLKDHESWTSSLTPNRQSTYLSFTIWDATTGLTQGNDTLWAMLSVPMVINVVDEEAPEATFDTLYWNSKEDSSTVYDENDQPLGHVDTEADLNTTNPQVAGQVWLRGTVTDSGRITEVLILEPNADTPITVAKYVDGAWRSAYRNANGDIVSTKYEKGAMVVDSSDSKFTATGWPTNWKNFEITYERKPSQLDHMITFRFAVDATPFGVSTGTFKVAAKDNGDGTDNDAKKNSSVDADAYKNAVQTTKDTPTARYDIDFVPYIKMITLSDGTEVTRSRLGRYPVRAGDTIRIYGMNFKDGETATVHFYTTEKDSAGNTVMKDADKGIVDTTEVTDEAKTGTVVADGENGNYVAVTAPSHSRYVSVTVQNATTANNSNNNKKGNNIEEGYIATGTEATAKTWGLTTASEKGTNFWTDDRYIAVWNVETTFPGSVNPHSGVLRKVRTEDTWNAGGTIGINASGTDMFNSKDYGMNMQDSFFGFIASDDMRVYQYSQNTDGTLNKRYTMQSNDPATFAVPVDAVDCIIVDGLPYYVVQTNYVGNSAAEVWGPGLILAREGLDYQKGTFETSNTIDEAKYKFIIERQGSKGAAENRSSADGYDSVLQQFKNIRMAGWHTDTPTDAEKCRYSNSGGDWYRAETDFIYISYYDSYAKCLKYAMYRSGRETYNGHISEVKHPQEWGGDNTGDNELIAEVRGYGNMTNGSRVVAGYDTREDNPSSFTEKAGEWSDIVLDTTGNRPFPIIVYYNETEKSLEVAVAKNSATFPKSTKYGQAASGDLTGEDAWTKSKNIRPSNKVDFGRYVSAAIDAGGNLHIAAQDVTNAKLYYLYLTKTSGYKLDTAKGSLSVVVDASSGAGRWTDIELTDPTDTTPATCKPVISYINTNFLGTTQGIKVAYLESVSGTTPNFEAMTDPAKWQAGDQRTSVLPDVKETKSATGKAIVGVGFNSDMLALDFLRGEQ